MSSVGSPKVKCPRCAQLIRMAPFCTFCGAELMAGEKELRTDSGQAVLPVEKDDAKLYLPLLRRWDSVMSQLENTKLVRMTLHPVAGDGSCTSLRHMVVPTGRKTVLAGSGKCEILEPGTYDQSVKSINATGFEGLLRRIGTARISHIAACEFNAEIFSVPFILPDTSDVSEQDLTARPIPNAPRPNWVRQAISLFTGRSSSSQPAQPSDDLSLPQQLQIYQQIQDAMATLVLYTQDRYLGTVSAQLELRVEDPIKMQLALLANDQAVDSAIKAAHRETADGFTIFRRGIAALTGQVGSVSNQPMDYTAKHLFQRVRPEFIQVVRGVLSDCTVESLYTDHQTREKIAERLRDGMRGTLATIGVDLIGISAFRFYSVDYDRYLRDKQRNVHGARLLEEQAQAAKLEAERRNIGADSEKSRVDLEAGLQTHDVKTKAEIEAARIDAERRRQAGERSIVGDQSQFKREQTNAEHQAELERKRIAAEQDLSLAGSKKTQELDHFERMMQLRMSTIRQAHELKMKERLQDREMGLKEIEALSSTSPEMALVFMMRQSPQLLGAFTAMQQAKSNTELHRIEREMRELLVGRTEKERDDFVEILKAMSEARKPSVVVSGTLGNVVGVMPHTQLPPADGRQI